MALNATTTATAIVDAIHAVKPMSDEEKAAANTMWGAIVGALYTRIKADMVVASAVASVSGVTTGVGVSGPGTATSSSIT
jgi:hypothetical protein